jgi:hypothetical protein
VRECNRATRSRLYQFTAFAIVRKSARNPNF